MKLPVEFEKYLRSLGEEFFVTSFDGRTARIYTIPEWDRAEAILESATEHALDGEILLARAKTWGTDTSIDNQGRVLIAPRLRRQMGVEQQAVVLTCVKGHVAVHSEAVNEEKMALGADARQLIAPFAGMGLR